MKYTYENIIDVQLSDWGYEEKKRENAILPDHSSVPPRFALQDGEWVKTIRTKENKADLVLAGDLMCQERLIRWKKRNGEPERYDFNSSFAHIKPILSDSDLTIANLESVIHPEAPYANEQLYIGRFYNRNGPPQYLEALRNAGIDLLTASNNHMVDTGMRGLCRTYEYMDSFGFIHTGSFVDSEEPRHALVNVNGIRVGVLSYTMCMNFNTGKLLKEDRKWMLNYYSSSRAKEEISALRNAGADYIICYIHWGTEMVNSINDTQLRVGQDLADFGVDFIVGSHPHVIQPFDVLTSADGRSVPVIYSMGNLLCHFLKVEPKTSIILKLALEKLPDGAVHADYRYIACYTFTEYEGRRFVTVPLTDQPIEKEEDNAVAVERKRHVSELLGEKIRPYYQDDPVLQCAEPDYPLKGALTDGTFILPEPAQIQTKLLNTYRVTEEFRKDYCDYMRKHRRNGDSVRTAISVGKKFTGIEDLSVEKNWDLLSEMIYAKNVLGFSFWEFFVYGLQGKTPEELIEFVPESVIMTYYRKLNTNREDIRVLNNKYLGYQKLKEFYKREMIRISGSKDADLFAQFCQRHPQFIAKPLAASIGKGVRFIDTAKYAGVPELFRELVDTYIREEKSDFICEELIHPHPDFAQIHPESVNSLRIFTYTDPHYAESRVVLAWLKAGRGDAVIDNGSSGGILASIDHKTGIVTTPARNEANETFERHPDTGFPFVGYQIEDWESAFTLAKEAAAKLKDVRIVGWDIARSSDKGWQIIEGNAYGMFNLVQATTQTGMRREFLREIRWDRYKG